MGKITTLVFDIGNVLIFFDFKAVVEATRRFTELEDGAIEKAYIKWSGPFGTGAIGEDEFTRGCLRSLEFSGTADDLKACYNAGFSSNAAMQPVIETCSKTHDLFYLSDTNPWHLDYLLTHFQSVFSRFKGGTTSFEAGCVKPDEKIYLKAAKDHGFTPSEAVFFDDREANVEGAQKVGMNGIVYLASEHEEFAKKLNDFSI